MFKEMLEQYDALIEQCSQFERKGKKLIYTSANGHMFSQLNKAGELGIRFDKETQAAHMETYNTTTFQSYGKTMQGYILIPESLWEEPNTLIQLLKESYDYVMTLDPK